MKPYGLKSPPRHAPARLKTTGDLRTLQRLMTRALIRPLTAGNRMQKHWIDGRTMSHVAAEFIKPNDRLTSFDRLEIYNRQYWFRLLDCFYDDNPGLKAILGQKKFMALAEAYLAKYPSRSFSLRNLCSRLEKFIVEEPQFTRPHTLLARDMARFEWAQIVAFDGASRPVLLEKEISSVPPTRLKLGLQPYITLLALNYAVDDFLIAVKKQEAFRGEASNAIDDAPKLTKQATAPKKPGREEIFLAVHRLDNSLYYKRLAPEAFKLLNALSEGKTVHSAVRQAFAKNSVMQTQQFWAEKIQAWFKLWTELGWFCKRA